MRELFGAAGRLLAMCWRQSPQKTAVAVGLMLAGGAATPLAALALRWLFNAALAGRTGSAIAAGAVVGLLVIGSIVLSHFAHVAYFELGEVNLLRYDEQLISLANGTPELAVHEREEHADRLTVLDQEVQRTRATLESLLTTGALVVGMLLTGVVLAVLHPLLLLLPLLAVPPLLVGRRAELIVDRARSRTAEPTRLARNLFRLATDPDAAKELRVFALQGELRRRHAAWWEGTTDKLWRAHRRAAGLRALGQLGFVTGYVVAVLLVVREAIAGRQTIGDVVLVIVLAAQVNMQVAAAVALLPELQRLTGVDRRLRELRHAVAPAREPPTGHRPPERLVDGITLDSVSFTYPGAATPALRDVSLRLPAGATVAIVGENGAGKTSLVNLLCGFYRPTAGRVLVDGGDLAEMSLAQWRSRIAVGFQDFMRYEFHAGEAIGVGDLPRIDSPEALAAAVDRAHARDLLGQLPAGLATQLGKSHADGIELSGGQWQKLALSRAFMRHQPVLLVLDEPASALDAEAEHALFGRYADQAGRLATRTGAVTLMVSHRFSTVRMADLIVVVADGQVIEAGDHSALMRAGGLYAELFQLQARAYR